MDSRPWWERAGPLPFQVALASFGILALELALIRWTAGQVRPFAYFSNLLLIGAFLGLGLGLALGPRRPSLVHATLPALALVSLALGLAEPLGLVHLSFPDPSVHLWGAEAPIEGARRLANFGVFLALLAAMVGVFVFAGSALGVLFAHQPPLRAYRWDLLGALAGILAIGAATAAGTGPAVWLALGAAPFAWLSRRPLSIGACLASVGLGAASAGDAVFSPYNRIDLMPEGRSLVLEVNRDFHQYMHDLSDANVSAGSGQAALDLERIRAVYDLPFSVNSRRGRALVVGAGTGNDVQAALRMGYRSVVSVDIDGRIIELGRRHHPERPYDDARVEAVVDDARAYFARRTEPFDSVVFGLLDSHAMFSTFSSLRLDNYVYTEEGLRAAWRKVGPGGHLSISFSVFGGPWIADRLYWTITRATGREPIAFFHGMHYGATFLVPAEGASLDLAGVALPRLWPSEPAKRVLTTSDDWPFLYLRPGVIPWGYLLVLSLVIVAATAFIPRAFGGRSLGSDFDTVLFLMGAAFLLIETRGVTALSLLFGSTWVVNVVVFSGVLVMALVANELVAWARPRSLTLWFLALLASVTLLWAVPLAALSGAGLLQRGLAGGLLNALPIGFAGVIVSMRLQRAANPAAALGSNLLGSVVGGCLEYLSMVVGLRALVLLALALYLGAVLAAQRERPERLAAGGSGVSGVVPR